MHPDYNTTPIVIFHDKSKRAAWAFWLTGDNAGLRFNVSDGAIRDEDTNSIWQVDGLAFEGSLAGNRLTPIAEAYVSYWFAWSVFQPNAVLWEANQAFLQHPANQFWEKDN